MTNGLNQALTAIVLINPQIVFQTGIIIMNIFKTALSGSKKTPVDFILLTGLTLYHYLCHSIMLIPILYNEGIPAPHLPDFIIDIVPYVPDIARYNYYLWLAVYLPCALYLFWKDKRLFYRFMILGGVVSILRGITIPMTHLGPVMGEDINAMAHFDLWKTWLAVVNPWQALVNNSAGVYLTKDLFFSGHVATTFLAYLYSRTLGRVSCLFLGANIFTVVVVFLSHLHYTIDVIGAYAIVYCLYVYGDRFLQEWFHL